MCIVCSIQITIEGRVWTVLICLPASTVSKLFQAQRQQPHPEPVLSQSQQPNAARVEQPQRSTLHAFWRIPQPAPRVTMHMSVDVQRDGTFDSALKCEDCDASIRKEDAMDLDDGMLDQETTCASCRRHVCDGCCVLGDQRVCLSCAGGYAR